MCLQRVGFTAQPAEKLSQVQTLVKLILSNSQHTRDSRLSYGKPPGSILWPALYLEESEFSNALSGQPSFCFQA